MLSRRIARMRGQQSRATSERCGRYTGVKSSKASAFPSARILVPCDPGWPEPLRELKRAVHSLELAGDIPDLNGAVAIVGTRFCDPWATEFARTLARDLAGAGRVIVSGGATGIDTAAHEGALDAEAGRTIVVLPSGLAEPYPGVNVGLFQRAARSGCVLSEIWPKPVRNRSAFLERNRLIASLATIVVVVQAPDRSGSLSTAAHAKKLKRELLAVPAAPWDPRGTGCLSLLAGGAGICRSAADVLSLLAPGARTTPLRAPNTPKKVKEDQWFDADQRALMEALADGPMGADDLCERAVLDAPRVQRAILMLLLSKVIHEDGSGRYRRAETS